MRIELREIRKTFGRVKANDGISLDIPASAIQGILGENGAGKSTLMKILSGFQKPDSGTILLDGSPVLIQSPEDAIVRGIGMLHQDPLDFPTMSILDDFILGAPGRAIPDRGKARKAFEELTARFEFDLDPRARVDSLTVGERQQLEIARLLWLGAKTLSIKAGWKGSISRLDGIGWIALAITIFGGWNPLRAAAGAYLFALLQWLGLVLQPSLPSVPAQVLQVAPFPLMILTLLVVNIGKADWVERSLARLPESVRREVARFLSALNAQPPASLGTPFDPE
jgi:ABC-type iron transport system FetAB ATPase subunit